ncbi:hypothetical protein LCGC14_0863810 [marine sediment metagenome]|uniref:N-alpha-acetyltransferase 60 n=1 Tax=marine sediment metagenome TaxID=412755 RepID=A0A0F9P6L9_9ZZZZ
MKKVIRCVSNKDMELLVKMYLIDVENHLQRAEQFANDLIFRFKTIICINEEKILGTITWDTRGGLDDGVVELLGLGVNSSYRRQGIAKLLTFSLIDKAKKYFSNAGYKLRVIYLFMERGNNIARSFYKNIGFREVSELPAFYPHDDAAIWIKYF